MTGNLPCESAVTAWKRLVRAYTRLHADIEEALKSEGLPPLAWYDVLVELHRAGEEGLRQFEIGNKTLLQKYNLCRLLDRLEGEELVRREACPEDGRGNVVMITDAGTALLKRMWPVYGSSIHAGLESGLSRDEIAMLGELLEKIPARVGETD